MSACPLHGDYHCPTFKFVHETDGLKWPSFDVVWGLSSASAEACYSTAATLNLFQPIMALVQKFLSFWYIKTILIFLRFERHGRSKHNPTFRIEIHVSSRFEFNHLNSKSNIHFYFQSRVEIYFFVAGKRWVDQKARKIQNVSSLWFLQ